MLASLWSYTALALPLAMAFGASFFTEAESCVVRWLRPVLRRVVLLSSFGHGRRREIRDQKDRYVVASCSCSCTSRNIERLGTFCSLVVRDVEP